MFYSFIYRVVENTVWPGEGVRVTLQYKEEKRRGENLLVTWSRSTSASSIFRYLTTTTTTTTTTTMTTTKTTSSSSGKNNPGSKGSTLKARKKLNAAVGILERNNPQERFGY